MEKQTEYQKIAALIAATANAEKIEKFAEAALKTAAQSYEIQHQLENILSPLVIQNATKLIKTNKFKTKLIEIVEQQLSGLLDSSVKAVLVKLISAISKVG